MKIDSIDTLGRYARIAMVGDMLIKMKSVKVTIGNGLETLEDA